MQKFFLFTMTAMLVCGVAVADRTTFDETKTRVAMPLPAPPVIDGVIDLDGGESWVYATGAQPDGSSYWVMQWNENVLDFMEGAVANPSVGEGPLYEEDLRVQMWVGYDADNLYVAVRVADDILYDDSAEAGSANGSTWEDDSIEVFVDGDNSNFVDRDTTGSNPEIVDTGGQYVITINNAYREAEAGNPGYGPDAAWYALTTMSEDDQGMGTYDAEFRISLSTIGNPQPGDIIGFTICVNDDDTGDGIENQYTWIGNTHEEVTYGNLVMGPRSYTAPKTAAPTVDGVINAAEYAGADEIVINHFNGVYNGNDDWTIGDHDWNAWVIHDDEAIYVAVSVTDDLVVTDSATAGSEDGSTWNDDSVEIFIDADASGDRGRSAESIYEGQYVLTANGAWRDVEANNPFFDENGDWFAATSMTDTGFQVEFKIVKEYLVVNPEDGSTIGFDIAVNDDDSLATQPKTQLMWNGRAHNESSYGELTLAGSGSTPVAEWSLF